VLLVLIGLWDRYEKEATAPRFQSSGSFRICDHCRSVGVLMA
jgi:hypothetical protein